VATLTPEPLLRPVIHAGTGLCSLLLAVLPAAGALACAGLGVVAGWVVIPLTVERRLRRPRERYLGGLRTYPLAVLGVVLLLPPAEAAAAWGILAVGDAAAAVVGTRVRSSPVLGHPKATWAGSGALVGAGTLASFALAAAVGAIARAANVVEPGPIPSLGACAAAALAAALVDLFPWRPDDNLPIAAAAAGALHLLGGAA